MQSGCSITNKVKPGSSDKGYLSQVTLETLTHLQPYIKYSPMSMDSFIEEAVIIMHCYIITDSHIIMYQGGKLVVLR